MAIPPTFPCPLFHLRIKRPSEALILRRPYKNDDLTGYDPTRGHASIGITSAPYRGCLAMRLERRKNPPIGRIRPAPCVFRPPSTDARKIPPLHAFWPAISAWVRFGRTSRAIHLKMRPRGGNPPWGGMRNFRSYLYIARIPARISTWALGETPQWPVVSSAGEWAPISSTAYCDVADDDARDTPKLRIECVEISGDNVSHWVTGCRA